MESPVGKLLLAADDAGLRQLAFAEHAKPHADWREDPAPLREIMGQLRRFFAGELRDFDVKLAPEGPDFHRRVWRELCNIPYGETISYGELARRVGSPNASRAVGRANGANPIAIVIPCHRVIGSNGKLTGYGGGLPRKEFLLALERKQMSLVMTSGA
ncbi:MAG TPA: methylated-DNA--[protein]-cysteine S-methyltransferase [Bryobacteraceae bacterium]|nr:methylated-DNA--[protein]-cysteine S-methyltransferase [Bryobacteraceae bacterium]